MSDELKAGLRFNRADGPALTRMAHELIARNATDDAGLFIKAAQCAEEDEPLIVHASTQDEVEQVAAGFELYGIDRPTIDAYDTGVDGR